MTFSASTQGNQTSNDLLIVISAYEAGKEIIFSENIYRLPLKGSYFCGSGWKKVQTSFVKREKEREREQESKRA